MDLFRELLIQIELHSPEGIRNCIARGINVNDLWNGESLIYALTSEYTRSSRFKDCVQVLVESGLRFSDPALLAVLLDDKASLNRELERNPAALTTCHNLRCAYTPLYQASLLHICAEYNHVACAEVLLHKGCDVNVSAGVDENGFGGQGPIFHTVNQNNDQSADMLNLLLDYSANLRQTVTGILWGKGYEWETLIPSVNPISYAMMGLLPQMHRDELVIARTVSKLMEHAYGIRYKPDNVPNRYLRS